MKVEEFLKQLSEHDEVKFVDSLVHAPTIQIASALGYVIGASLEKDAEVHFALETSAFEKDVWKGQLVWWLVLKGQLLELAVSATLRPRSKEAESFKIALRFLPLQAVSAEVHFEHPGADGINPKASRFMLTAGGKPLTFGGSRISTKALTAFQRAIFRAAA